MGNVVVDQIGPKGELINDVDTTLTETQKNTLLLEALPGATTVQYAGQRVVRYRDQVILKAQVTYLGIPWESFKKRIQVPRRWVEVHDQALSDGLTPRFVGIYHYGGVTLFVDFDPSTYVTRKANNSAAHLATNDLFQAQTLGLFSRTDRNGNRLTGVRVDLFADYIRGLATEERPYLDVFKEFNAEFLGHGRLEALDAVQEMYRAQWPDTMQGEWAGFYLEYRLNEFLRRSGAYRLVAFQKVKRRGDLDYDLVFTDGPQVACYGDLKASSITEHESPGNDAEDLRRCVALYGRFWYVIYEHETWHSREEGDLPVIEWNEWRRSVGHVGRNEYNPLSYARRFKSAVRFSAMFILEVNRANFHVVLGDFNQGRQPDGASRALKVMVDKRNIDNFLIFSASTDRHE
ncbi:hypothetical protein [Ornithinimicrobium cerasi]|uniref:Methylase-associated X1 domain-containing protein n=1 Tax=Ornithinimicrobium cerasi TaxID=2248773 RepID=A0A285W0A6_9MICO|nr:hypothetical protein [Ornithinimicrobium cerasi]SOC58361.1 hypothetical protein SAMN05421879_1315 [Ornithinimicrobium cerasi]SOC58384.1 hypothetical protein SAMN05421879_1331 [Ornithinimicrobium cerasi]